MSCDFYLTRKSVIKHLPERTAWRQHFRPVICYDVNFILYPIS
jgi:hypothetical protein